MKDIYEIRDLTLRRALNNSSDYFVIARPITASLNPLKSL